MLSLRENKIYIRQGLPEKKNKIKGFFLMNATL